MRNSHISIPSLFYRHSPAIRMWGIYPRYVGQGFKSERLSGTYLYTRWSNAGDQSRAALMSYYLNPGSPKVNAGFPLKPVLITAPSLVEGIPSRRIAIKRASESVYKLTTTLLSAIWGGITPSFLLSRTPTQSNMTSFGSPPTLGLDPPRPKLLKSMCAIESGLYMSDLVGADDAFSYPLYR